MNEFGILFGLLTQMKENKKSPDEKQTENLPQFNNCGATEEEICTSFNYSGKYTRQQFSQLMERFSRALPPFGLTLRQNPFTKRWFLSQHEDISEFLQSNPFSDKRRLAATLCSVLSLCILQGGAIPINQISEIRKKKDIQPDLDELARIGLIDLSAGKVSLNPAIGYFIDMGNFLDLLNREAHHIS